MPELVGIPAVMAILDVSNSQAHRLAMEDSFPQPYQGPNKRA